MVSFLAHTSPGCVWNSCKPVEGVGVKRGAGFWSGHGQRPRFQPHLTRWVGICTVEPWFPGPFQSLIDTWEHREDLHGRWWLCSSHSFFCCSISNNHPGRSASGQLTSLEGGTISFITFIESAPSRWPPILTWFISDSDFIIPQSPHSFTLIYNSSWRNIVAIALYVAN